MYMSLFDLIVYVLLGVLIGIAYSTLSHQFGNRLDWKSWLSLTLGILLVALSVGWLYASLGESEMRAGFVGLMMFGVPGIIFGVLGFRLMKPAAK